MVFVAETIYICGHCRREDCAVLQANSARSLPELSPKILGSTRVRNDAIRL